MPHPGSQHRFRSTAVFVALLLLVQLFVGGFAIGGAAAGSPMLDAFGNPLCIASSDVAQGGEDGASHTGLPDCCAPSCSMFAPATAADRSPAAIANPLDAGTVPVNAASISPAATAPDHDPGRPRAPPPHV